MRGDIHETKSGDSLLVLVDPRGFCPRVLPEGFARGFCPRVLPEGFARGFCSRVLLEGFARGFCPRAGDSG